MDQVFFRTIFSTAVMLLLFSIVPPGRLNAQSNDTLLTETPAVPDTIPVSADSTDDQSIARNVKTDIAATTSADTALPATDNTAEPFTIDETSTADSVESANQDPKPPDSLLPQKPSGYYQGYSPVNYGIRRGINASGTPAKSSRKPLQLTDTMPSPAVDTSALPQHDRLSAVAADPSSVAQGSDTAATPVSFSRLSKRAKIITAVGTTAAIIGVATFILVKKYSGQNSEKDEGIPDPPSPPGYW